MPGWSKKGPFFSNIDVYSDMKEPKSMTPFHWNDKTVLGIIAGGGHLPLLIAEECKQRGIPYHLFPIQNQFDPALMAPYPHTVIEWGQVSNALDLFRDHHVNTLVMAGGVKRPSFSDLKMDMKGIKWIAHIGKNAFGDDGLLSGLADLLAQEGFKIVGSQDILPRIKTKEGVLTHHSPSSLNTTDIIKGTIIAHTLGKLDVGQSVILENGVVLGVEGIEGTAALIDRCHALKRLEKGGVLVKACKPQQSKQVDLPTIGPDTIDQIVKAGLDGIAIEAEKSLILFPEEVIKKANDAGVFICGF